MWILWKSTQNHNDSLRRMAQWEWIQSRSWIGCKTGSEAARELTSPLLEQPVTDLSNRFRQECAKLCTVVTWLEQGSEA
eukprot:3656448-Rhodomonas_salina.1